MSELSSGAQLFLGDKKLVEPPVVLRPLSSLPDLAQLRFSACAPQGVGSITYTAMLQLAQELGVPGLTLDQVVEMSKWRNDLVREEYFWIHSHGIYPQPAPLFCHCTVIPSVLVEKDGLRYIAVINWGNQNLLEWRFVGVYYRFCDTLPTFSPPQ